MQPTRLVSLSLNIIEPFSGRKIFLSSYAEARGANPQTPAPCGSTMQDTAAHCSTLRPGHKVCLFVVVLRPRNI